MDSNNLNKLLRLTMELDLSNTLAVKLLLTHLEKTELEEIIELSTILILAKRRDTTPKKIPLETLMDMSLDEITHAYDTRKKTKISRRNYRRRTNITVEQLDNELEEYMSASTV